MYWWLAQDLAERGYVVLTYDVQGQGRSETFPHQLPVADLPGCTGPTGPGEGQLCDGVSAQQASNFVYGTDRRDRLLPLDAVSSPIGRPRAGTARVSKHNPLWALYDVSKDPRPATPGRTSRLGLAGHSLGAGAVSYVQAVDKRVSAVVALDKLNASAGFDALGALQAGRALARRAVGVRLQRGAVRAARTARRSRRQPGPPDQGPDPMRELRSGFTTWQQARVDSMVIVPAGVDAPRVHRHLVRAAGLALRPGRRRATTPRRGSTSTSSTTGPLTRGCWRRRSATSSRSTSGSGDRSTLRRSQLLSFYYCSAYAMRSTGANKDIARVGC